MRAAELQIERLDFPEQEAPPEPELDSRAALKQQIAERLAEHRSRRKQTGTENLIAIVEPKPTRARANRIANAVAERYAQSQSYRDFLAAEAARAIEAANAAAEIAARNAAAITVAQQQLLAELEQWNAPGLEEERPAPPASDHNPIRSYHHAPADSTPRQPYGSSSQPSSAQTEALPVAKSVQHPIAGLTVRLYEDVGLRKPGISARANQSTSERAAHEEEADLLDEEIAFRQTPVFAEPAGPPIPIPANLIEFPRQLVAPRKSRPRIAEGPLREEAEIAPATAQLRIFEVEPEQISTALNPGVETVTPEWSSIHLDAAPAFIADTGQDPQEELHALLPLETASLDLRLMSVAVDGCILGFTFLVAAAAFAFHATELPSLPVAAIASAATLLILFVLYHLLFFTFSDATPGMRYARIGLCTFSDENPTRAQMRRRTWAILLSACPLGIGFFWALLDDDRLGWHDRITRMYQRGY